MVKIFRIIVYYLIFNFNFDHVLLTSDAHLNVPEIITKYGYPVETHTIQTEDGYLLGVHRIPYGKNMDKNVKRQPVFVHHAFLDSSADFVFVGEQKSLGFILARAGYDVWLGNARGNKYSRAHVSLSPQDEKFWDFSWDEMALYDLPAVINHIGNHTKQEGNLLYIGHSMGNTIFFALMAAKPEYNDRVKAVFGLAPCVYYGYLISPVRYLAPFEKKLDWFTKYFGFNEFFGKNNIVPFVGDKLCLAFPPFTYICETVLFIFAGFDKPQMNSSLLPVILNHTPAGTSMRTLIHYMQMDEPDAFRMYDYGPEENLRRYGNLKPPEYDLNNVIVPTAIFYSDNDWLAVPKNIKMLYDKLPNKIELYRVPLDEFNHLDFIWGIDAPTLVYEPLLKAMKYFQVS